MPINLHRWFRVSLINLLIVALLGVVLRYKIAFYLPFVHQKSLLHGHSHYAFTGWITMALMALLLRHLQNRQHGRPLHKIYSWLLWGNLLAAVGMLISFPIQGYGAVSISFSSLAVLVSYVFAWQYWVDLKKAASPNVSDQWFRASLFFSVISSLGAFSLAAMMATKSVNQEWYLASEYYFLHFQYNGWFFFACMGLVASRLFDAGVPPQILQRIFWLFALAAVPAYFLSTLWANLHLVLYILTIIAVILQIIGWIKLASIVLKYKTAIREQCTALGGTLLLLSFIAFSIKIILQSGSVIPVMSTLAFGFRPIVIGYLHLVLLAVTSLCIIGLMLAYRKIALNKPGRAGAYIFTAGIIINELLLMTQGLAGMYYIALPHINEWLFGAALIMFSGIFMLNIGIKKSKE
ncbi:MAG TPA: hypothetical protein DHV17_05970 [Chitinophagaceae bacterium]|nr:hypothetical protein [Chitinophagaceae bacterium]